MFFVKVREDKSDLRHGSLPRVLFFFFSYRDSHPPRKIEKGGPRIEKLYTEDRKKIEDLQTRHLGLVHGTISYSSLLLKETLLARKKGTYHIYHSIRKILEALGGISMSGPSV